MIKPRRRAPGIARRRFLSLAAGALAGAACSRPEFRSDPSVRLAREFTAHFDYLTLEPEGLRSFLDDYQQAYGPLVEADGRPKQPLPFLKYLESSDFFLNDADESRAVSYVMLNDPYLSPCFNPFRTG